VNEPTKLREKLTTGETRGKVIQDCVRLIDTEVRSKRGLLAVPLKAGYKVIQGVKPGFVGQCVDFLLDDFCDALDPHYGTWAEKDPRPSLADDLNQKRSVVADSLLGVTDRRAERSSNRTLKKLYNKLRGAAKGHVEAALPGLARTIEPYLA
jgi:hypothetical protein